MQHVAGTPADGGAALFPDEHIHFGTLRVLTREND